MRKLLGVCLVALVAACGGVSTMPPPGSAPGAVVKTYPAHGNPVRVVRGDLPPGASYEVLGMVKAIEDSYGSAEQVEKKIAERAREIGADAIIQVKVWHSPRPFAWAAPHAEGLAVKILKPESVNLDQVPGTWY
jgi:hypothetical protein